MDRSARTPLAICFMSLLGHPLFLIRFLFHQLRMLCVILLCQLKIRL